ncbi:MAG: carboxylesterase family protein [Eubacteriales bacterium]
MKRNLFTRAMSYIVIMLMIGTLSTGTSRAIQNVVSTDFNEIVIAKTIYGSYAGLSRDSGVTSFLGVPYAKQPIGQLRWKEAQPLDRSKNLYKAYVFGNTCLQPIDQTEQASLTDQGEDCLTLNVWTKNTHAKKPTMVFIHGGANVGGGSADSLYNGENFVKNNDVVMVTINYRLGPFGFLDLSEIGGPEYANSRNLGVLDQIAALRWVKNNISHFGGDPNNITVFGESAGGSAIIRLMSTPLAEGLFQKAIIESGGPANLKVAGGKDVDETAQSKIMAKKFLEVTGKKTIEELQNLSAKEIENYAGKLADALGDTMDVSTWAVKADNYAVPLDVFKAIKNGAGSDVKVLIGTNEDEINYFKLYDWPTLESDLADEYKGGTILGKPMGTNTAAADKYIASQKGNPQKYTDFAGEFWLRQPSMIFAELQSKYNDVYMYSWAWDSKVPGLGACHAVELPFVFGNLNDISAVHFAGTDLPIELSIKTQAIWTRFAYAGNPSIRGEVAWPKYNIDTRATMVIDNKALKIVNDPKPEGRLYLRDMFYIGN